MEVPADLKTLSAFIKRAEELDRDVNPDSRTVAYFCRMYAVQAGMRLPSRSPEATRYLGDLLSKLERDRASVPNSSRESGKAIVEAFAVDVFFKADEEDRNRVPDKNTAKIFYAASTFLEVIEQFGTPDDDILEKKRYAKFKAAEIARALKEGRVPTSGSPTDLPSSEPLPSNLPNSINSNPFANLPQPSTNQPPSAYSQVPPTAYSSLFPSVPPQDTHNNHSMPFKPDAAPIFQPSLPVFQPSVPVFQPPAARAQGKSAQVSDALELCQFAISALKHDDIPLAIDRLEKALHALK